MFHHLRVANSFDRITGVWSAVARGEHVAIEADYCAPPHVKERILRHIPRRFTKVDIDAAAFTGHVRPRTWYLSWVPSPLDPPRMDSRQHRFETYLDEPTDALRERTEVTVDFGDIPLRVSDTRRARGHGVGRSHLNLVLDHRYGDIPVLRRHTPAEVERLLGIDPTNLPYAPDLSDELKLGILALESDRSVLAYLSETQ